MFKWSSTNETISYNNWAPNEPNNFGGNEQCVQMFGNVGGSWNDIACSSNHTIVCQIPGVYVVVLGDTRGAYVYGTARVVRFTPGGATLRCCHTP